MTALLYALMCDAGTVLIFVGLAAWFAYVGTHRDGEEEIELKDTWW